MNRICLTLILVLLISSCRSYKDVPYLKDVEQLSVDSKLTESVIKPGDILSIVISSTNPKAVAAFNMVVATSQSELPDKNITTQPSLQNYLVNKDGEIKFPILGIVKVSGLTRKQIEDQIAGKISDIVVDKPVVTVRIINYKISVLGEVNKPGTFSVTNEKVNLLEALSMAGDLTIHGRRDNIKLIRENEKGKREVITLNINKKDVLESEYYELQQNDVIYVTPNKTKAKNSDVGNSTGLWFSATSILVSLVSLIVTIAK